MIADPVTLAAPEILHRDEGYVVWHAGVIVGPTDVIVLSLEINPLVRWREFVTDRAWRYEMETPPIEADVVLRGQSAPVGILTGGYGTGRYGIQFQRWIGPVDRDQLPGAKLHIKIHPLDLRLTIDLGPQ